MFLPSNTSCLSPLEAQFLPELKRASLPCAPSSPRIRHILLAFAVDCVEIPLHLLGQCALPPLYSVLHEVRDHIYFAITALVLAPDIAPHTR